MKRVLGIIILCVMMVMLMTAITFALVEDGIPVLEACGVFFIILVITLVFSGLLILAIKLILDEDGKKKKEE